MRKILIILALIFNAFTLYSQNDVSDSLRISVLTCAEGKEIYASFGHCAFRVVDKKNDIDKVYNYGTFNYKQPYFVLKFVKGFLNYSLSAYSTRIFNYEYTREQRQVREQVLNLTPEQAQRLYDFLEWNALEENRHYKYNFLEDNCATKIRDIISEVCGNDFVYPDEVYDFSLRDQINCRITEMPWFRFGISLLMGLPVDKKADSYNIQFLPDFIYEILNKSEFLRDGKKVPVVSDDVILVKVDKKLKKADFLTYFSPFLVFSLIFAVWGVTTYYEVKKQKYNALIDRVLFVIVGLFGVLFFVMWFFTEHTVTAWNLNLLWAWPSHLIAAFFVKKQDGFWKKYFKTAAYVTALTLILGPFSPQQYDIAFYPVICIILLRLVRIGFCKK
ncbi:MAG: DUF4105 domain-containing protein [Bacteroidales bacterium]|nr:DUF4105 domain-containing protein [Bacteroidales bacterium]